MTKTHFCVDELSETNKPLLLHPRDGVVIPSAAFDMASYSVHEKFKPGIEKQWEEAEKSDALFIAHALSFASQRRVLNAYYSDAENLSAEQLIRYAPFTVLAVRQLISGSLIDIQSHDASSLVTRNGIGFLLKVPPSCFYVVSPVDANVPMEKEGVSQHQFREQLFGGDVHERTEHFNQHSIALTPADLLRALKNNEEGTYNEIALVPRTLNPDQSIRLAGVFIDSDNLDFGRQGEKGDCDPSSYYFDLMFTLSRTLDVPFFDLRELRTKA